MLATVLTRNLNEDRTEVPAFSLWHSEGDIRAFTGKDITAMALYPQDEEFLLAASGLSHHDVPFPPQNHTSKENCE